MISQLLAVVLAAADVDRNRAGHRAKPDLAATVSIAGSRHVHRHFSVGNGQLTGKASVAASAPRLRDGFFDPRFVASEHMHDAIDDNLRRVDVAIARASA